MRAAKSGHIINITSVGGLVGQPFNESYCAAKFAVKGYTESLASYVTENFGIKFSLVEPGGISSEFANSVLAQHKKELQLEILKFIKLQSKLHKLFWKWHKMKTLSLEHELLNGLINFVN